VRWRRLRRRQPVRPPRVGFVLMGCLLAPSRKLRGRELPCLTPLPTPSSQHEELRLRVDNLYYLMYLNVVGQAPLQVYDFGGSGQAQEGAS
jgi:hypothetical protein